MIAALPPRVRRLTMALGAVALVGLAFAATLGRFSPSAGFVAADPTCTSCDARHARLADLRAKPSKGTE